MKKKQLSVIIKNSYNNNSLNKQNFSIINNKLLR